MRRHLQNGRVHQENHRSTNAYTLRGRHGDMFGFADIMAFLAFVIAAGLIFIFLFKPLAEQHITNIVHTENLSTDANYIATTVPRMRAIDAQGSAQGSFGDTVRVLAHAHAAMTKNDFTKALDSSSYSPTVDAMFLERMFVTNSNEKHKPLSYAIVLRDKDGYWLDTCREYTAPNEGKTVCPALNSFMTKIGFAKTRIDETTGLEVPVKDGLEVGTSYVPTADGPVYINIFLVRDTE